MGYTGRISLLERSVGKAPPSTLMASMLMGCGGSSNLAISCSSWGLSGTLGRCATLALCSIASGDYGASLFQGRPCDFVLCFFPIPRARQRHFPCSRDSFMFDFVLYDLTLGSLRKAKAKEAAKAVVRVLVGVHPGAPSAL